MRRFAIAALLGVLVDVAPIAPNTAHADAVFVETDQSVEDKTMELEVATVLFEASVDGVKCITRQTLERFEAYSVRLDDHIDLVVEQVTGLGIKVITFGLHTWYVSSEVIESLKLEAKRDKALIRKALERLGNKPPCPEPKKKAGSEIPPLPDPPRAPSDGVPPQGACRTPDQEAEIGNLRGETTGLKARFRAERSAYEADKGAAETAKASGTGATRARTAQSWDATLAHDASLIRSDGELLKSDLERLIPLETLAPCEALEPPPPPPPQNMQGGSGFGFGGFGFGGGGFGGDDRGGPFDNGPRGRGSDRAR